MGVAAVVEAVKEGQHEKEKASYVRYSIGTRKIANCAERDRYRLQVWGP